MATKLLILQFGGGTLGEVTQSESGQLSVQAYDPALQAELQNLLMPFTSQPLSHTFGHSSFEEGKLVEKTLTQMVSPGDAHYLPALADALTTSRAKVGGKRIHAQIIS
jgi:hypothetical protein